MVVVSVFAYLSLLGLSWFTREHCTDGNPADAIVAVFAKN